MEINALYTKAQLENHSSSKGYLYKDISRTHIKIFILEIYLNALKNYTKSQLHTEGLMKNVMPIDYK